ncbi:DUF3748 domain-containing protein [Flexithrix dorotheae]|uniref:DUF3748 domain-containing protein n=1 Tax=Flexithrix dorotheae TaxID=70993 RepID=UPI00036C81E7|nr:DUF3748 domain-containing protein [Flexithrix dorotheae]
MIFKTPIVVFIIFIVTLFACHPSKYHEEIQLTSDFSYNHDLDNNDNFSPDDQWLVYDTRTEEGGIGGCSRIEKVNTRTGEKVILYELPENKSFGPGVGAVSYSHQENKVVFIHGLLSITEENPYEQWRRSGVIVEDSNPGKAFFMDARDVTFPYTPGALRGGTHRHEWSGDGKWIGFTYNDAILKQLEDSTGQTHNLRTIGVSKKIKSISVEEGIAGENVSGEWFTVIVVKVTPDPVPGSDEISRAAGDSWVGMSGYKNSSGNHQMARAFLGTVKDEMGKDVNEVFIVDIPEDITIPGDSGPLEGTKVEMPAPPRGTVQRRLTFTANAQYPGCTGIVRSAPDGNKLAFRAFDKNGTLQIFTISPHGGEAVQQTFHQTDVESGARWHPDGERIVYIWKNSLIIKEINQESFIELTKSTEQPPADLVISHDGKTIAYNRMVPDKSGKLVKQIFIIHI